MRQNVIKMYFVLQSVIKYLLSRCRDKHSVPKSKTEQLIRQAINKSIKLPHCECLLTHFRFSPWWWTRL